MSEDQRTDAAAAGGEDAAAAGGEDAGGAPEAGAPGGTATTDGDATDAAGTYPAEKLDLGGGTSDGDTPSENGGG